MNIEKLMAAPLYFSSKLIDDKPMRYEIAGAEIVKINNEERLVLTLKDELRQLRLTPPQVTLLGRIFGPEADKWKGRAIELSKGEDGKGIVVTPVTA